MRVLLNNTGQHFLTCTSMGCRYSVLVEEGKLTGLKSAEFKRCKYERTLNFEWFSNLPDIILVRVFQFLTAADAAHSDSAFGKKFNSEFIWQHFCRQRGIKSRKSCRCVGNIVVTNRPGKTLSWKRLYILDCQSDRRQNYLSYHDGMNQKYVVFVD